MMSFELTVLLRVTVIFGVTALAVFALPRASAATRHTVWGVGFLAALILPFGLAILPVIELPLLAPAPVEAVPAASLPPQIDRLEVPAPPVLIGKTSTSPAGPKRVATAAPVARVTIWEWRRLAGWIWILGSLAAILRLLFSNREVVRLKRSSTSELPQEMNVEIEALKGALSIATPVAVRIGPHEISPMTCGIFRQMILMPPSSAQWTEERRSLVLAHELAHATRHDGLTQAFVGFVCALYWFHPAAWLAARRMRLEREHACDDAVLSLGVDADNYVDHLLGIAREINSRLSSSAVSMAHPWQLESRLRAILDPRARRRTLSRFQKVLLLTSAVLVAAAVSSIQPTAVARARSSAQQFDGASSQALAKLEGTVLDAETGRPVTGAEVELATGPGRFRENSLLPPEIRRPISKPPYSTTTDSSGRFMIHDIRPGAYRVGVFAPGYVDQEVGQRSFRAMGVFMNFAPDSAESLVVRLTTGATIGGRITDSARQPVKGVPVYLLQQGFDVNGTKKLIATEMTEASNSGAYEFTNVAPGPYSIVAGRGATLTPSRRSQPVYGWTFYPGRSDASLAARIDAWPGATLGGLDLVVDAQQPRRMIGAVIDSRTGKPPEKARIVLLINTPFELMARDFGGTLPYDPETGRFEATGLIDGVYTVGVDLGGPPPNNMTPFPRDGWYQFEISGSDTDDLVVHVPRSGFIHGRITLEGSRPLSEAYPAQGRGGEIVMSPSSPRIWLQETNSLQPRSLEYHADTSDGTFEVSNVLSGRYRLQVQELPAGYYVKVVRLNGTPATDRLLDLNPEERIQLDITIAPGAGEIRGVVVNDRREPLAAASGLLLPDPLPYEIGYFRTILADGNGAFTLNSLRPGNYRIYAFDGLASGEFPEPDLLRLPAARATSVAVAEGSRLSVTARAVPIARTR